jgi:hypothetical protein
LDDVLPDPLGFAPSGDDEDDEYVYPGELDPVREGQEEFDRLLEQWDQFIEDQLRYIEDQASDDIDRVYLAQELRELQDLFAQYEAGEITAEEFLEFEPDFILDVPGATEYWESLQNTIIEPEDDDDVVDIGDDDTTAGEDEAERIKDEAAERAKDEEAERAKDREAERRNEERTRKPNV